MLAPGSALVRADVRAWLSSVPDASFHAVVTDPPYGLLEYEDTDHEKLRGGRGGVWRMPPTLDGVTRAPVPRFTVLDAADRERLRSFFEDLGRQLLRVCVPGAHLFVASNPLLSTLTFAALGDAGWEKRGEIIRLVQTLRGGDRPKGAHAEFADVSVMPRSAWEPWGLFRRPIEGTVAENLRKWGTGGLRRRSADEPFRDVIPCAPTRPAERRLADHPSLKPQRFLRQVVRAALPLGQGIVLDPFAGSGSTVAAAAALGYAAVGVERDPAYFALATRAFPALRDLVVR
jgi:site-specific DNA-methyltransferase (adenine-specific)